MKYHSKFKLIAVTLTLLLMASPVFAFQRGGRGGGGGGRVGGGAVGGARPGSMPAHVSPGVSPGFVHQPGAMPSNVARPGVGNGFVNQRGNAFGAPGRTGINSAVGYRPGGVAGTAHGFAYKPYAGYHPWVGGYWRGPGYGWGGYGGWGGGYGGWGLPFWGGFGLGLGLGSIGPWGLNPYSYGWGYSPYSNPFFNTQPLLPVNQPVIDPTLLSTTAYDYNKPIDVASPPVAPDQAQPALDQFAAARDRFKVGDYPEALRLIDGVIKSLPNDADAHEFRGLTLFALGRYKESATTLYSVLAAGPGWDWATLIGLYPSIDVYTGQLRSAEKYRDEHPEEPTTRFVLGYLYSCQGSNDAAVKEFAKLATLIPNDQLIARLARAKPANDAAPEQTPPVPAPAGETQPTLPPAGLMGTWSASPAPGTTIRLTLNQNGSFVWEVGTKDQTKPIKGTASYKDGVLALTRTDGPPLAGKVTLSGDNKFNFKLVGNGQEDPGLNFSK